MVGLGRLERPTSPLSGVRSNHLSYRPSHPAKPNQSSIRMTITGRTGIREERETRTAISRQTGPDLVPYVPREPIEQSCDRYWRFFLRKEVIQPQVPLRLPCYDFTPVADPTVVVCPLAVGETPSGKTNSHGVTGGVYKARERIHRSMLICDY